MRSALSAAAAIGLACTGFAQGSYLVVDIGTLGGNYTEANGINDAGQIVGCSYQPTFVQRAYIFSNGWLTPLSTLDSANPEAATVAWRVNSLGHAVGEGVVNGFVRPTLFIDNSAQVIGGFDGPTALALDINDAGTVVGYGQIGTGPGLPFVWSNGSTTILNDLGAGGGATAISENGIIVGALQLSSTPYSAAVLFNGSVPVQLGTLGGNSSYAHDVNANGVVVGWATTPFDQSARAAQFQNGQVVDLGVLPGYETGSEARAINENGDVVGVSYGPAGIVDGRAFIYQNGKMVDLNSLLPPGTGWVLTEAQGINSYGQIVGRGRLNGNPRGFLLSPSQVIDFSFGIFQQPVNDPPSPESVFKRGRVVPLKLSLNKSGQPALDQAVQFRIEQIGTSGSPTNELDTWLDADSGPYFRSIGNGTYTYHLRTDNLPGGFRYRVSATVWAGQSRSVTFAVR